MPRVPAARSRYDMTVIASHTWTTRFAPRDLTQETRKRCRRQGAARLVRHTRPEPRTSARAARQRKRHHAGNIGRDPPQPGRTDAHQPTVRPTPRGGPPMPRIRIASRPRRCRYQRHDRGHPAGHRKSDSRSAPRRSVDARACRRPNLPGRLRPRRATAGRRDRRRRQRPDRAAAHPPAQRSHRRSGRRDHHAWVTTFTPEANPLPIIGPPGTAEVVEATLKAFGFDIGYRIAHHADLTEPPPVRGARIHRRCGLGSRAVCRSGGADGSSAGGAHHRIPDRTRRRIGRAGR